MTLKNIKKDLRKLSDKDKASHSQRYFKSGQGEYAEGDKFLGVTTPNKRKVAKKYSNLPHNKVENYYSINTTTKDK